MTVMPGAVWRPITIPGGNPGARTKGRGVILHVAASEATSLFGFFNNNPNANSHFYVNKAGVIEQMVDTDVQAWASMAANRNTISVETQGGVTNPDGEPWTAAQVASLARICAWAHATEGVPLALMPNSLPTSRGIGYHRLGIDPWRVAGGETWSGSRGKLCPGAAKIAQIPQIIAAASGTTPGDDMPTADEIATAVHNKLVNRQGANQAGQTSLASVLAYFDAYMTLVGDVHGKVVDSKFDLSGRPGADKDDLLGQVLSTRAAVQALASQASPAATVDASALAAALLADEASVAKLGDAIAAGLAKRVGNG